MSERRSPSATPLSLTSRALNAVAWSYFGVLARVASQLAVQIVLARILGPETFGLFAAATVCVGLGVVLIGVGHGSALVQKKEVTEEDVCQTFTWSIISAIVLAGLMALSAGPISSFFQDSRLTEILYWLSPVFIFMALSVVPQALLRRELSFKKIQIADISSYIFGFLIIGVGSALAGAGIWSLVAAWIAQAATNAFLLYMIRRPSVRLRFVAGDSGLRRVGFHVTKTNVANLLIENADRVLVGRLLGTATLGLYSLSYTFVRTPANHAVVTLQGVLFSASAQAQGNLPSLQRAFLVVISAIALVMVPILSGVATVPATIVGFVFGESWLAAAPILTPLSLAMIFHALMAVCGPVLLGRGVSDAEYKVQLWVAPLLIVAVLVAARHSAVAVGWAVAGVYAIRLIGMFAAVVRHIEVPIPKLLRAVSGGIILAAPVVFVLLIVEANVQFLALPVRLLLETLTAAATFFATLRLFQRQIISLELRSVLMLLASRSGLARGCLRLVGVRGAAD